MIKCELKDFVDALRAIAWHCWRMCRRVKRITALTDADVDRLATSVCQALESLSDLEIELDEINARNKEAQRRDNLRP